MRTDDNAGIISEISREASSGMITWWLGGGTKMVDKFRRLLGPL